MGFFLTVVYIVFAVLSPADLAPTLAGFRIELVVALLALLFSASSLLSDRFLRSPQVYLLAGLLPSLFLSEAIGNSWIGGGFVVIERFLPDAIVFVLILLNCRTIKRLKILASVLVLLAFGLVLAGGRAYLAQDLNSPLLYVIQDALGEPLMRMRGLGFLEDPNDLAQFFVVIMPFFWMLWQDGRKLRNISLVLAPTIFFIAGVFMTHSRGGMVALLVILVFGLKDRLGLWASTITTSILCLVFLLLDFSGGRSFSMEAGANRMEFWATGLQLFKSSPIFGIGYGGFAGSNGGHTAHNSFVLCLAELGIVGYLLWMGLLVSTFSGLNSSIATLQPLLPGSPVPSQPTVEVEDEDQTMMGSAGSSDSDRAEIYSWAKALRISLAGFVAAAWFLSRAYSFILYIVLAMAAAICWLTLAEDKSIVERQWFRLAARTAVFGVGTIVFLYVWLRARSLF